MTKCIFFIYITIIVNEIFTSCIVWRIDIYDIYTLLVSICQDGEGRVVVSLDQDMSRSISSLADTTRLILDEYGEFIFASFHDSLWLVFPDETISFLFFDILELGFEFLDSHEEIGSCGHKKGVL
jgi:hypothetical protein